MEPENLQTKIHQVHDKINKIISVEMDDDVESKLVKLICVRDAIHGVSDLLNTITDDIERSSPSEQILPKVEVIPEADGGAYDLGSQESTLISESQLMVNHATDKLNRSSAPNSPDACIDVEKPSASHNNHRENVTHPSDFHRQNELVLKSADDALQTEENDALAPTPDSQFVLDDNLGSQYPDHNEFKQIINKSMKDLHADSADKKKDTNNNDTYQQETQSEYLVQNFEDKITESVGKSLSSAASSIQTGAVDVKPPISSDSNSKIFVYGKERITEKCTKSGMKGTKCILCNKSFVSLETHTRRVHKQEKTKECHLCGFVAFDTNTLNYHMSDMHTHAHRHRCRHCGKGFNRKSNLMKHQAIYPSGICISSSRFRQCSKDTLKQCNRDDPKGKNAQINIRKVSFPQKSSAKEKKVKSDNLTKEFFSVTLFPCVHPQCSEVFALRENLDRHKDCHMTTTAELVSNTKQRRYKGKSMTLPNGNKVIPKDSNKITRYFNVTKRNSKNEDKK